MDSLTPAKKTNYLPIIIARDGGFRCFYCKQQLSGKRYSFDHLDNNRTHNNVDNIVICHQKCNIKKIHFVDYQIMAQEKLKQNEEEFSVRVKKPNTTNHDYTSEIGINIGTYDLVESYLEDEITTGGFIPFTDALYSIVYLCKQKFGHGSEPAVRRHLNTLTSSVAPYEIIRNNSNEKIIVRRKESWTIYKFHLAYYPGRIQRRLFLIQTWSMLRYCALLVGLLLFLARPYPLS